jgi:ribosome-associated protein
VAEKLRERLKSKGCTDIKIEGLDQCNWVIVDAGDIVVHLFRPEVREFYNLEKMWQDFPQSMNAIPNASMEKETVTHL